MPREEMASDKGQEERKEKRKMHEAREMGMGVSPLTIAASMMLRFLL